MFRGCEFSKKKEITKFLAKPGKNDLKALMTDDHKKT